MNKEELINIGINYEDGLNRFCGSSQLYEKYLIKFFDEDYLLILTKQINEKEFEEAFETMHALKGVTGNLSMNKLHDYIVDIVEELRNGNPSNNLNTLLTNFKKCYEETKKIILK